MKRSLWSLSLRLAMLLRAGPRRKLRWAFAGLAALLISAPAVGLAGCKWDLPDAVFLFFHEKPGAANCDNYEYKFANLTGKKPWAIIVSHYVRSCDSRSCDNEIFEKRAGVWEHVASVPGRVKVVETMTNGHRDIRTVLGRRLCRYVWDGATYLDAANHTAAVAR